MWRMVRRVVMEVLLIILLLVLSTSDGKKASIQRVLSNTQFGKFIGNEMNYTQFLRFSDNKATKVLPFQDTSNDTFFRVGIIHKSQLENYTSIKISEQLGDIKNKPWLPLQTIKEEMVSCLTYKFGAISENDFKYDKGLYGWFNIMKFSCTEAPEGFYIYAMGFSRTRFRLRQVYLRRQNKFWATSGRSIISRDVQKLVDHFSIQYASFVMDRLNDEMQALIGGSKKKDKARQGTFLKLPSELYDSMKKFYPNDLKHTPSPTSRLHTFNTIAVPIKTRIILARVNNIGLIVDNLSNELTDDALETMDSCSKTVCTFDSKLNATVLKDTYNYKKEKVLTYKVSPVETLLTYQSSKAYFKFDVMKRKTRNGIVDVKQTLNEEGSLLWQSLLEQQLNLAVRMHSQNFFMEHKKVITSTFAPNSEEAAGFEIPEVEQ